MNATATPEPVNLTFFDDADDLRGFFSLTTLTYSMALAAVEGAGLALAEENHDDQAVLLGLLVNKMLQYKAHRATELATLGPQVVAEANAELTKVWPIFEAYLEKELEEAGKMIEKLRAERGGQLH